MRSAELHVDTLFASPVESEGLFVIQLGASSHQESAFLELQRDLEEDHLDAELGLDTYCLVPPDGPACYGCVKSCVLKENRLTLTLTAQAARMLGVKAYHLHLELHESELQRLRHGLQTVFTNRQPRKFSLKG